MKTLDQIRLEGGIRYRDIYKRLPGVRKRNLSNFMRGFVDCHQWSWMIEAALCEVMREIAPLQTDIEHFAGGPPERTEIHETLDV